MHLVYPQLALFAAAFSSSPEPLCLVLQEPLIRSEELLQQITAWQQLLRQSGNWHLLPGSLSEAEQTGRVITRTSLAYHALLSAHRGVAHRFIIPSSSFEALHVPAPAPYVSQCREITIGEKVQRTDFISTLVAAGYIRTTAAQEPGALRVRGEIVDIKTPLGSSISISFHGSTIEQLTTQQGTRKIVQSHITIPPASFPAETVPLREVLKSFNIIHPLAVEVISEQRTFVYNSLTEDVAFPFADTIPANYAGPLVVVYENYDRTQQAVHQSFPHAAPTYQRSALGQHPMALRGESLAIVSESALVPPTPRPLSPISRQRALEIIATLEEGRPAVHADHGIGIYEGMQRRTIAGVAREYLILRYAEGDMLSVPVEFAHKVTRFIGDRAPLVHRLGGTLWLKTKKKAQEDAVLFAQELLAIARQRTKRTRPSYLVDPAIEEALTASFPFTLTPDQERTWQEVAADLSGTVPMDRLIVGDVGFGKTEIAIRAARHVLASGRQVAILAPTTLLVQQHTDTFRARLPELASTIASLSRFASSADQTKVRAAIAAGSARLVIGAHGILSSQTKWKDLGLVIIDEEQRFGVAQKEHFKKLRASVDMLSLSATPIPRTLSMALSGLRDLSIIETAPPGRLDVNTTVAQRSLPLIRQALTAELARQGQAYVVAPRVRQLAAIREEIQALLPQASIAIAHGQLPPQELAETIHQFDEGSVSILVSSNIVENGLDLPRANTLIVWDATYFGLSDLYQLRGRVGRRRTQGHAYFLYGQTELTPLQRQRLRALLEASRVGSGWAIARQDLEIRGAGNLLGAQQSGSVEAVGVQLYLDLVNQVVESSSEDTHELPDIRLPFAALLPTHYIADEVVRSRWYQRLTRCRSVKDLQQTVAELTQAYGPPPLEAAHFIRHLTLQRAAAPHGVASISVRTITPTDDEPFERLEITARDLPQLIIVLSALGTWRAKQQTIFRDEARVTPQLIDTIIDLFSRNRPQ